MDEDCEHNYYWCQMLEEFEQIKLSLEALTSDNQCDCSCDDNENPIYCVKNYKLYKGCLLNSLYNKKNYLTSYSISKTHSKGSIN